MTPIVKNGSNGKVIPVTDLDKPRGYQEDEAPRFQDSRHMKVLWLSALRTAHLYPQKIFLLLICVKKVKGSTRRKISPCPTFLTINLKFADSGSNPDLQNEN